MTARSTDRAVCLSLEDANKLFNVRLGERRYEVVPHAAFARRQAVVFGTVGNAVMTSGIEGWRP